MAMNALPNPQRRALHRIRFPLAERPRCLLGTASFVVLDLSETSCRIDQHGCDSVPLESPLSGLLRFVDGDELPIEGRPIRSADKTVVIQFSTSIPLKKMIALQCDLHRRYPALRDQ